MENYYYYYSYYCSYLSVLSGLCSTIVLKTWNVDNVRNPLVFYNFDIRFPFGVFIPEKKKNKLHHFIKHCKSTEKNIRSNLHNINRMSRILFMKWRKNMLATASEKIWRELCFHRVKMASRAAKKKTLLPLMMMQDEELPVSYERRINYHSCTGDAPIFNINANSLFSSILLICSLLSSGIAIFKHERAELWELKMLISDWFIFNWSQGPVPRSRSHEVPSTILRGPVLATGPTNSNQFEFLGPISGTKILSLRLDF